MEVGFCAVPVPERLDTSSVLQLEDSLERALADHTGRVVVLRGRPGTFCEGMSLEPTEGGERARELHAGLEAFARCLHLLRTSSKPTMAVVEGIALGGGMGVAAACDFVLATEDATFGLPEALWGLTPAIVRPALLSRMRPQTLRLLALTAWARPAVELYRLGLVDQVVPAAALEGAVRSAVRAFARARTSAVVALRRLEESAPSEGGGWRVAPGRRR